MKTFPAFLLCCALTGMAGGQTPCPPAVQAPAAIAEVSSYLINALVERPVDTMAPVRDTIIDAEVTGLGHTRGVVKARPMADAHRAWIDFVFMGTSIQRTIGVQAPAKLHTETKICFELHQPVTIDSKNLRTWSPLAWVKAQIQLVCITNMSNDSDSPVVGMARLQFNDDKNEAETITAKKAECKLKADFAAQFLPEIEKASRKLNEAWKGANWLGVPTQPMCWSSTESSVRLQVGQLATGLPGPPTPTAGADFSARVHQTVFRQMAQQRLAGNTFTAFDLADLRNNILELFGTPDASAKISTDTMERLLKQLGVSPLSITFVEREPVTFHFEGGVMTLTMHGKRFKAGPEVYPGRDVVARYRLEAQGKEWVMVRDGEVKIQAPGPYDDLEPARKKDVENTLRHNFNLFLPQRLRMPTMKLGAREIIVAPSQADAQNGWLVLGWTCAGKCR